MTTGALVSRKQRRVAKKKVVIPQFAKDIFMQLGQMSLTSSAIVYCGGTEVAYGDHNPQWPQIEPDEQGMFKFDNCFRFRPNTRARTLIIIGVQPLDTYTVWFWRKKEGDEIGGDIIDRRDDVYCDELADVVERMYDRYIREYQKGEIDLT